MASSKPPPDMALLLRQAWDSSAEGYDARWVAHHWPWNEDAIKYFTTLTLPEGTIVVPGSGPGQELVPVAQHFPKHSVVGLDISSALNAIAQQRAAKAGLSGRIKAETGNAANLTAYKPIAGVLSCLLLQAMPDQLGVVRGWLAALQPGAVLAVLLWSSAAHDAAFDSLFMAMGMDTKKMEVAWDEELPKLAASCQAEVIENSTHVHEMRFARASDFWDETQHTGPLKMKAMMAGPAYMAEAKQRFLQLAPQTQPFLPSPTARLFALRKL